MTFYLTEGDSEPRLAGVVKNNKGEIQSLAGYTARFSMWDTVTKDVIIALDDAVIDAPLVGHLYYEFTNLQTLEYDRDYHGIFTFYTGLGKHAFTCPNRGYIKVKIQEAPYGRKLLTKALTYVVMEGD